MYKVLRELGKQKRVQNITSAQGWQHAVGLRHMSLELGFNPETGDLYYNPYKSDKFLHNLMYPLLRPIRVDKGNPVVVEVGIGGGYTLPFYYEPGRVVYGVDPEPDHGTLRKNMLEVKCPVENLILEQKLIEKSTLPDNHADYVISVLTLSCVRNVDVSLKAIKRILKPGGTYFFFENTVDKEAWLHRIYQNLSTPLNRLANKNMYLNRNMERHLARAQFSQLQTRFAESYSQVLLPICFGYAVK
eukprot:TRINITY_DN5645_c1_g1_i3.p2 TRINITY_DN5645_c1_g1~~TRINITY_DN5645_c1_g1_i3.p2  ORF type:complete len:252 (+),score=30.20 TRINITY_DN5645_c1_g1_i3:24-758(+)